MVLLGDEAQLEAHFGLFGDSISLDARLVNGLPQMYHRLRNHFRHTRWNP
jgi:superfamily I DNA and/or RNA helicase